MLKKLVKYGNSNALVLDRALLEILNIAEGSVVKIKTDGTSLVITPHNPVAQEQVSKSITPQDTLVEAMHNHTAKFAKDPEQAKQYMAEMKEVFQKYHQAIQKLESPECKEAIEALDKQFNGDRFNLEFFKASNEIRKQFAPELVEMDKEIQELSQKYAPVEYQYKDKDNKGAIGLAMVEFKKIHEKYKSILQQIAKLQENPDYIHELVLLSEKYHVTKDTPEYLKEYTQLITKYIPEYEAYQAELKAVAETCK